MRWAPLAVLAAAGLALLALWDRLPETWAVHRGLDARPDRWARRTPFEVFFLLGLGLAVWCLLRGAGLLAARLGRGRPPALLRAIARALDWVALGVAALTGTLALALPLVRPARSEWLVLGALAVMGAAIAAGLVSLQRAARRLQPGARGAAPGWHGSPGS
jgi:hypothetical protein